MSRAWATPTSSCCRSASIRSTNPGATSRSGCSLRRDASASPQGFARFVDKAHAAGLGVIVDWVPAHFPTDEHGLAHFDGTALYEHADPRKGFHPDWNTAIYNFGRHEVANFLYCNALYWVDRFHIDGLRVDAVASMLYLDYSRREGEWLPNADGSKENREAIAFLQQANQLVYGGFPGAITIAEESTAFPGVSRPTDHGGLGFGFKWNMGWMHDTLDYMSHDPIYRRWSHDKMTFGLLYAFSENFVLPISHDEVVHGKGSVVSKMPGDEWQRFANARAFYGFMWGHPGKKLLFMGQEFGQTMEWNAAESLPWWLLDHWPHQGVQALIRDLNRIYRETPALYARDCEPEGFRWIVVNDDSQSVLAFLRRGAQTDPPVAVVCNFTPEPRMNYRLGLPYEGHWREALNSDAGIYGGSNMGNLGGVIAEPRPSHGFPCSATLALPPLATAVPRLHAAWRRADPRLKEESEMPRTRTAKEMGLSPPYSRHAMAYVLAGGRGSRLMELTDRRAKPAVYFAGKSRIIDFALSNALNSGIRRIAVATQYKAHSLIRHLQRGWNFLRPERNESFDILPASQRVSETMWYLGTADAVYQNIDIIESYNPHFMVVLAGDHVYKMDYEKMLQQHVDSDADVTVGCLEATLEEAKGFGVMHVDEDNTIIEFLEKPKNPPHMPGKPDVALASMGIYVFETSFLIDLLKQDAADPASSHDFGKDIIPYIVKTRQGGRAPFLPVLRPLDRGGEASTGATSAPSTPTGRPTSTSPTSSPISTFTTAPGRSGPTARSRRRPNSCTTSTAGAASPFSRCCPADASSRAPRSAGRWSSPASTSIPTRPSTRRSSCPMRRSGGTCGSTRS